jgi:hypothetical protein
MLITNEKRVSQKGSLFFLGIMFISFAPPKEPKKALA